MPTSDLEKIISTSVVPAVIISACGLLCLAFYNRLAAIVSRLRTFQRERLHEQQLLDRDPSASPGDNERRRLVLDHLKEQTRRVTRRAKLIRLALLFLLVTISLLICCSLTLGLSVLASQMISVAVAFFATSMLSMLIGVLFAIVELNAALQPAELESQFVSAILGDNTAQSENAA